MSFYFMDGKKGDSCKEKLEDFTFFYLKMNLHSSIEIIICNHIPLNTSDHCYSLESFRKKKRFNKLSFS